LQYNALLDLSTSRGTDIYSGQWTGPPSAVISGENQTVALSLLVNAISLTDDDDQSPTSSLNQSPTSTSLSPSSVSFPSPPSSHALNIGPIIGGVLGGLTCILVGFYFLWRHRSQRHYRWQSEYLSRYLITPFSDSLRRPSQSASGSNTHNSRSQKNRIPASRNLEAGSNTTTVAQNSSRLVEDNGSRPAVAESSERSQAPATTEISNAIPPLLPPPRDMTTDELIDLLNQRLQPGPHWDEEMPPEYPHTPH
jgi:hypothetical protein